MRYFFGKVDMYAKTEVFVSPDFFQYYIDRKKTEALGVRVPANALTATTAKAKKAGYVLRKSGEIVTNQRILTPDKIYHEEQKKQIDAIKKAVGDAYEAAVKDNVTVAGNWLKDTIDKFLHPEKYIPKEQQEDKSFYDLGKEYLKKNDISEGYQRSVMVLLREVFRYEGFRKKTRDEAFVFDPDTLTRDDMEDFFDYVANEKQLAEENPRIFEQLLQSYPKELGRCAHKSFAERSSNYMNNKKKKMRAMLYWLLREGKIHKNPMEDVKIDKEQYGKPYYITIDERNTIAECDLSEHPSLAVQRDIFIFQCLVGCRVSDLMRFTKNDIIEGVLTYVPHKTKKEGEETVVAEVPLLDEALRLVAKYDGKDTKGRLFPFISAQKYNDAIKEIFTLAGITRKVIRRNPHTGGGEIVPINEIASSHLARRTFVGNIYEKVSDPNLIGKMSGHAEGSRAFSRYRDIKTETLKNVINLIG